MPAATWVMLRAGDAPWGSAAAGLAESEAAARASLAVHAHSASYHGLPVWSLEEADCLPGGGCLPPGPLSCTEERPDLTGQLLAGLAVWHAQTPLGWPLVELRHAAAEIESLMAAPGSAVWPASLAAADALGPRRGPGGQDGPDDAGEAANTCQAPLLPRPKPLAGPVTDHILWRVNGARRCVALTFDACSTFDWGAYNLEVIATLRRLRVPATLFVGGHWAELHPQELAALAAEPLFELGNHTYSHPHMADLDAGQVRQQVLWAQWAIFSRTGRLPSLLRLPYAEIDARSAQRVVDLGMTLVEYDLPAGDADVHVSAERLSEWVSRRSYAGSIVIMHMNKPGNRTAEALPTIVARLAARGLRPCTVSATRADGGG